MEVRGQPAGGGSHLPPGFRDETPVIRLGGGFLYPLSHLTDPKFIVLNS